ncbi:uncharacterized protein CANTADRAFT_62597 [Suhomyces tanzawaensis NRRL Y-17324]|uniref:Lysophospholipase n=1 Tax=Suhomyces tanzawaensis NRRL Y-17324 TaxID=984487 RepID=A0A1E4SNH5_9ASCO|nr:uncharacterized protein CANTADRAFT_62597 [Suhomyces tanzawaensis NRRL Y-17324]ODV81074.1 hypothetical protein CANTADRAFT_62597 [Suhomyces tanzawaensis NRRL Y-17324]
MKLLTLVLASLATTSAWSPTDSYAPGKVDCPSGTLTRKADSISPNEADWIKNRHQVSDASLEAFLNHCNMTDFDVADFLHNKANKSLTIGLAFSGGGYRAMLAGAGQLAALDNRTRGAYESGLGGLLQASTYLVGLSGGNWLVGTIALNNFTSVQQILDDGKIWDLDHSIVNYGGINIIKTFEYYNGIRKDIDAKRDAGFEVSLTDIWGRALSHQFFSTTSDSGAALTWSTVQDADSFTSHQMPFPIVVLNGRAPNTFILNGNSTVFETNAFELGSWDPSVYEFSQVKYLGSGVSDGRTNGTCVQGFDNAGYIMGTSSSLFNQFLLQINTTGLSSRITSVISGLLSDISKDENDIAVYKPNPFYHSSAGDVPTIAQNESLFLVDGGEDGQNVPLSPLIQPERQVDVIFAFDNSADTDANWPNGTSLVMTYDRQTLKQDNGTIFPHVPDAATFRNLNLTSRPAFFGCDAKNLSSLVSITSNGTGKSDIYDSPLVVYIANRPFSYFSNTSTFKMKYDEKEKRGMIENGFEVASRLNHTLDSEWSACVGCAIIRREQERLGIEQSDQCKQCFQRYCWDGKFDSSQDAGLNFTETGLTNGPESTGNKTSMASSLIGQSKDLYMMLGYAFLVTMVFGGFSI